MKLLEDGALAGLLAHDPLRMGCGGLGIAPAASRGEKIEAFVETGANLIAAAEIKEPRSVEPLSPKAS